MHQTAKALHAAHASGIIHRDIKPGNLLVTADGAIKVTDFGIARALEAAPVTQTARSLGTAQYVSPEQAQGLPLTPATDLYSLGVVAYECLSGRPPFRAETPVAIALLHLNEQPPPLPAGRAGRACGSWSGAAVQGPRAAPGQRRELGRPRVRCCAESLVGRRRAPSLSMLTDPSGFGCAEPAEWPRSGRTAIL